MAYGRFNRQEQCVIVVNNNPHELDKEITVWEANIPRTGAMVQLIGTSGEGYSTEAVEYRIYAGKIRILLPGFSAVILKYQESRKEDSPAS